MGDEVAERLSKVIGRRITFNSLTPDEFASDMSLLVTGSATLEPHSIYDGMAAFIVFTTSNPSRPHCR